MIPVLIIGLLLPAFFVLVLLQAGKIIEAKPASAGSEVETRWLPKGKGVHLVVAVPVDVVLVVEKNSAFYRMLANSGLFPQPTTGDAEFDAMLRLTAYRADVLAALQAADGLRQALMQLAIDTPRFSSLSLERGELTLAMHGSRSDYDTKPFRLVLTERGQQTDEKLNPIREKVAALQPDLLAAFSHLPANTAQEKYARLFDRFAIGIGVAVAFMFGFFSFFPMPPLASTTLPVPQILTVGGVFLMLQLLLMFGLTTQGSPRLGAMVAAVFMSCIFCVAACPNLVRYVNGMAQPGTITETAIVASLDKIDHGKNINCYLRLKDRPARLAYSVYSHGVSLPIDCTLYDQLKSAVRPGSEVEIDESTGLLGLPYVTDARPR